MKERLLGVAKWIAFPAFYLFCLGIFGYLKFPYDRLKDRIVLEIEKRGKPGQRLEVGHLGAYWFTGVELSNVKLHLPADEAVPGAEPAKPSVIAIDAAHARVRVLPLLIGRVRVDFWASAFGGEIKGTAPVGDGKGDVELELDKVDIGKIDLIAHTIGVPVKGIATGKLALSAPEGKFNKANGTVDFTIEGAAVSDGKTKIQGLIELPQAKLGTITLSAEAKDGVLKITKFAANGTDMELVGDGKVTLREPWSDAPIDLYLRFKFTDAYRGKNATTKTLLGEPGSAVAGLIEMQVPKMKRAKRPDGFYGWHVHGPLKRLKFDPSASEAPSGAAATKRGKGSDSPFGAPAKRVTPSLPLGVSTARSGDDQPAPPAPPPAPAREVPDRAAEVGRRAAAAPEVVQPAPSVPAPPALQPAPEPAPVPEQPAAPEQPAPDQPPAQ